MSAAWVALYHFPDHRRGFLLTLAENREDYYRRIAPYLAEHPDGYAPLAPLPVSQWFEGYTYNHALWLAAAKLTVNSPVQYIPLEEPRADEPTGPVEAIGYLEKDVIEVEPLVLPLVDFAYKPSRDTPQALDEYFADLDQIGGDRYYAIINAAHNFAFPDTLLNQGYPAEILFRGETAEKYYHAGPYLIELRRGAPILKDLMTWDRDEENFCFWGQPLVLYLRSAADFQTVSQHFRKFIRLQDVDRPERWVIYKFYDPRIAEHMLNAMDTEPARLKRFFGDGLIRDYAIASDNAFTLYRHRKLPEDLLPAKIELGDWEKHCFLEFLRADRRREKREALLEVYPHYEQHIHDDHLQQWEAEARRDGYDSEGEMWCYLQAALLLCTRGQGMSDWVRAQGHKPGEMPAQAILTTVKQQEKRA